MISNLLSTKKKGWLAEWVACGYLVFRGYLIIEKNFRTSFGELDIIAKKNQTFVIVEVKSRYKKDIGIHLFKSELILYAID